MSVAAVRVKPRFFLIVAVVIGLLIWGISCAAGAAKDGYIQWGSLETDSEVTAIVIRDEQVVRAENIVYFEPIAAEGEVAEAGQAIAALYTVGYSEKDLQSMMTLQKTIKEYQQNNILKNIVDENLNAYNANISAKLEEISRDSGTTLKNLLVLEGELSDLMNQRRDYMRQVITPDSTLESYYQQEEELQTRINDHRQLIGFTDTAVVSFFLDGYEDMLNAETLGSLTIDDIRKVAQDISARGDNSTAEASNKAPAYLRAVNNDHWFLAFVVSGSASLPGKGGVCEMTLDGYGEETVTAEVYDLRRSGSKTLVILEVKQAPGAMLRLRRVNAHLGKVTEGYKVPLKALNTANELTVRIGGQDVTVPVNIVAQNKKYAIVEEQNNGTTLMAQQKLVMP